jgi:hypothetical protein
MIRDGANPPKEATKISYSSYKNSVIIGNWELGIWAWLHSRTARRNWDNLGQGPFGARNKGLYMLDRCYVMYGELGSRGQSSTLVTTIAVISRGNLLLFRVIQQSCALPCL